MSWCEDLLPQEKTGSDRKLRTAQGRENQTRRETMQGDDGKAGEVEFIPSTNRLPPYSHDFDFKKITHDTASYIIGYLLDSRNRSRDVP